LWAKSGSKFDCRWALEDCQTASFSKNSPFASGDGPEGRACHLRRSEGPACQVRRSEGRACHLRRSEGPACQVRVSEGRACHVRLSGSDDRSPFCGHDKRAPPIPFPEGPACQVRFSNYGPVGQIGGPGSTRRTLLVGAIHELPLRNFVHVACRRFFAKWGWLRLPPLLAIFFSIPDSQKFLYEISFVRPLIMWWGNPADWACSIEPPYSARLPPGNMSTTFTGRDFVAKTSHTWRRRTYAVDPADTSGLSGQCSRS